MSEHDLMQSIKATWGTVIADACKTSRVPPAFIAALIAGESGGKNDAKRFEKSVLTALWEVLLGRKASFGSIGRADLVAFVTGIPGTPINAPRSLPPDSFQRLDVLATSFGLTQIMGYHVLEQSIGHSVDTEELKNPNTHLAIAMRLLAQFANRFGLDVMNDFEQLFRCWNTGQPDGRTFDPAYVGNALARMAIWTSLELETT